MNDIKFTIYSIIIHILILFLIGIILTDINIENKAENEDLIFKFVENKAKGERPKEAENVAEEASSSKDELKKSEKSGPQKEEESPAPKPEEKPQKKITPSDLTPQKRNTELPQSNEKELSIEEQLNSVKKHGGLKLNTYAWEYAPYLKYLKRVIESNLNPPYAFTYMGVIHGDVLLKFRIYPNGGLEDLNLIYSNTHSSLEDCSRDAVTFSAPFRPLPKSFPREFLEITALFSYINNKE